MLIALGAGLAWGGLRLFGYQMAAARLVHIPMPLGDVDVPPERTRSWSSRSRLTDTLLQDWASRPLPDWQEKGKVAAPRIVLAKLALQRDLDATNAYLQAQAPWGRSGSTWELHPEGDYDFTLVPLTAILYLYGEDPDVLYPETRQHLLDVLLVEEGGDYTTKVPRSLGLVRETENHIVMTAGSRYLKNRWLRLHGSTDPRHDNAANGLEAKLLDALDEFRTAGFYEFNSIPYDGYMLTGLLNLEAFGSETIAAAAGAILDRANWTYALGSLGYRRYPPFRRQLRRADVTAIGEDYHTAMMRTWMSFAPASDDDGVLETGLHHALLAAVLPYRLPDRTATWVAAHPTTYFVRVGHGLRSSPELYSGGPGYLLGAGGVHRGKRSLIVARPITLLLDDGARDLAEVLHLAGPGEDFTAWNNTGVHRDFAVAAGPVHVPEPWQPEAHNAAWTIYHPTETSPRIAVHTTPSLGVVALFPEGAPDALLEALGAANPDTDALASQFRWPEGPPLAYDVDAPKHRWVMTSVDGAALDRAFDRWPLLTGTLD
jgi:hypothetical protein